jgi:hypothetical protein
MCSYRYEPALLDLCSGQGKGRTAVVRFLVVAEVFLFGANPDGLWSSPGIVSSEYKGFSHWR